MKSGTGIGIGKATAPPPPPPSLFVQTPSLTLGQSHIWSAHMSTIMKLINCTCATSNLIIEGSDIRFYCMHATCATGDTALQESSVQTVLYTSSLMLLHVHHTVSFMHT